MQMTGIAGVAANIVAFLLGLTVGSFLNVVIYRLPREGLSVARPRRSFCPNCHNQIQWYDNIPVLSWLLLKGHCRNCRMPVSVRYPLVELAAAFLSVYVFQAEGLSFRYFFSFYFALALMAIAFIDLELMVIPDILVKPTIVLGLISALVTPYPPMMGNYLWYNLLNAGWHARLISLIGSIGGLVLGYLLLYMVALFYKTWRGHAGLGDGDPPLLGLIGAFLGWIAIFPVLFLATVMGLMSVGILLITGRFPGGRQKVSSQAIPFGPFLAMAALVWYFYGAWITEWYLNIFV